MTITLNHAIVPARDKMAAAQFFARIFGLHADPKDGHFAPDFSLLSKTCFSRVYLNEAEARPIPTRAGMGKRYASAPASCGTEAGASAGFFGSSAAETASSTRSSQMNSISRRATSGMSS